MSETNPSEMQQVRKYQIAKQALIAQQAIYKILQLVEDYDHENPHDSLNHSEWLCDKYPFEEDLYEYPAKIQAWRDSMHQKMDTVYIVEECQFPLDEKPEWLECCVFTNLDEAQAFSNRHYDSATNYTDRPNTCTCESCEDGWTVPQTWWKSYSVRVRKSTRKEN